MGEEFIVKDSGNRQSFETGAVRDTAADKPRPDLVSPFFLMRLGEHMRKGAAKYDEHNWEKGIPSSRCLASAHRHLAQFEMGDTDEDHLAAVAFNIMAIIHNQEVARQGKALRIPKDDLNDLPIYSQSLEDLSF